MGGVTVHGCCYAYDRALTFAQRDLAVLARRMSRKAFPSAKDMANLVSLKAEVAERKTALRAHLLVPGEHT